MNFHFTLITAAAIVVLAVIFSIIAAFASLFGLDFSTAKEVCGYLFITTLTALGLFIATNRSKKIIPATLVCYFYSFYPAYKFWAYGVKNTFHYNYLIGRDAPWYANNWIQFGIAIAILLIGHFFIWATSDEI